MENIRKHFTLAALLLCMASASAQVFTLDEDEFNNSLHHPAPTGPLVPFQGGDDDQSLYTPLGGGMALLAALGGAYLLGKRKKDKE